jgi:hypothetical protein
MSNFAKRIRAAAGTHPLRLVSINLLGPGIWVAAVYVGWRLAPSLHDALTNILLALFATAAGTIAGYFASPFSQFQRDRFAGVAKTVSAILSGYLLAKIDKFVTALFDPERLASGIGSERILLVLTVALVSALIVFNNRLYFSEQAEERSGSHVEPHEEAAV